MSARYPLDAEEDGVLPAPHVRLFQHLYGAPALLAGIYFAMATMSLYVSRQPGSIATIWYANAVAVAFLLHAPAARRPALWGATALACVAANLTWDVDLAMAVAFLPANLLEIAAATALLRRGGLEHANLRSPWALVRLLGLGAVLPQALGATVGALTLQGRSGLVPEDVWLRWFEGSVIGGLSILVLACLCLRMPRAALRAAWLDWRFLAMLPVTLAITLGSLQITAFAFIYVSLPLLLAAMIVDIAALCLLTLAVSLTVSTAMAVGLFVPPPVQSIWEQGYVYLAFAAALLPAQLLSSSVAAMRDTRERLETRTRDLELANERLEQFVRIASHDLREPLNTVTQFAGLLQADLEPQISPEGREYLRLMSQASQRMRRLLDDVLRFARLKRGTDEPAVAVDLNQLIAEVREGLAAALSERRATLEVSPLPVVQGHMSLLSLLFQNLLANGLKFMPPGQAPHLQVSAESVPGWHVISVRDNGIGIAPGDISRLFKPFSRLHPQRLYEGTGLGLTLCQQSAQAHGGRIEIESQPGQGSCFRVWLPASPAPRGGAA